MDVFARTTTQMAVMAVEELEVSDFDIAIVGAAGRFPGASDLRGFWSNLAAARESITTFDDAALLAAGIPAALVDDPHYVKAAPVLEDPGRFDAAFFGYSPRDATLIDPQQRQLLEIAWLAFEDAGIVPGGENARTATFAGTAMNTYLLSTGLATRFFEDYLPVLLGADKDFQATRVAFKLGLTGPAVTVQTACSTSLVAIHLACQSLINRESDLALATAAAVRCPLVSGHLYEPNSVFTPDAHCRPFDDDAAGTIFGSGAGAVLMKRLRDALDDGDPIRAVIKGSAINNDGDNKSDFTAPTVHMQAEAISEALGSADVPADSISYVEAHGTGTFLGDPIEVAALTRAFRADTEATGFCGLGSVKSNIGHLDAAAGMASLLKVVLAMEHRQLPATLHFTKPNAQIDFSTTPFRVIAAREDWQPAAGQPRRAGITSLGMGGTNAHVVVEEAPSLARDDTTLPDTHHRVLLPLSARTDTALDQRVGDLAEHLSVHPDLSLDAVAATLQHGRRDFAKRRVAIAASTVDAADRLRDRDRQRVVGSRLSPRERDVVMMFPGQGAQHVDMGRTLYDTEPVFRDAVDRVAVALRDVLEPDIRAVMFAGLERDETALIDETWCTQPALFAIEHAYLELWRARGIEPVAFIGHSIGEYVAATAAGVFSVEDAARLVVERGRLMQSVERGAMLAVHRPEADVVERLPSTLDIAVINAADAVVVAGESTEIANFAEVLAADDIRTTVLRTSHAFHSRMMEPVLEAFAATVASVDRHPPTVPFVSNRSGTWITEEEATDPAYWSEHIRGAVRFDAGIATLLERDEVVAIEAGPGGTLSALFNQHESLGGGQLAIPSAASRKSDLDDAEAALLAFGQLWCTGFPVVWPSTPQPQRRVALPGYRFEGKTHWYKRTDTDAAGTRSSSADASTIRVDEPARWVRAEGWSLIGADQLLLTDAGWTLVLGDTAADGAADGALRRALPQARFVSRATARGDDEYRAFIATLEREGVPARIVVEVTGNVAAEACFLDLVHIVQALAGWDGVHDVALDIVTSGSIDTLGDGIAAVDGSVALGVVEVARKEWPHIRTRLVDAGFEPTEVDLSTLARVLGSHTDATVVGVHDGRAWARQSVDAPLSTSLAKARTGLPESGGHYVLAGGFGGIGRVLALHLAERGARLVMTHRPAADAGDDERAAFVAELVALGGEAEAVALSLEDAVAVTELFKRLQALSPLTVVFNLAGRTDDGLLSMKDDVALSSVLGAKLVATRTLDQALASLDLDVPLVLFSSVAAWSGPIGQIDYAAANAWQMAFARREPIRRHPVVSIAWPGWRDTGMVTRIGDATARRLADEHGVDPAQAIAVLDAALGSGRRQLWVSPVPLTLMEQVDGLTVDADAHVRREAAAAGGADAGSRDSVDADDSDARSVAARVATHWKNLLGFDDIGVDENYFELGGTSLVAVKLCGRLEREFDVSLAVEELIAAPTIATLASLIESRLPATDASVPAPPIDSVAAAAAGPLNASPALSAGAASLVPLSPRTADTSAAPVYLVHAHGGMVIGYQRFAAEIARHRPVFGLQSRGVRGDAEPHRRIEDMAAHYAAEIVGHRPEGPLVIGGYCMGGTIAWEIARQLESQGRNVALVFMLQSFHRDLEYPIVQDGRTIYPRQVGAWRQLTLYKDKGIEALARHARDAGGPVRALSGIVIGAARRLQRTLAGERSSPSAAGGLNSVDDGALLAVHSANGEAFYAYDAGELHSPVAFYAAEHQPRHIHGDRTLGWQAIARGRTFEHPAPGSFLIGLDGLGLAAVADRLEDDIRSVLEPRDDNA